MRKVIAFIALLTLAGCCGGSTEVEIPDIEIPEVAPPISEPTLEGAGTEESPYVLACTHNGKDLVGEPGASYFVTCPADCIDSGSVWGSTTYTRDSKVCKAAIHAGAVKAEGGTAQVNIVEGKDSYEGTEAHGVTTSDWGSYATSYEFVVEEKPAAAPAKSSSTSTRTGPRGKKLPNITR